MDSCLVIPLVSLIGSIWSGLKKTHLRDLLAFEMHSLVPEVKARFKELVPSLVPIFSDQDRWILLLTRIQLS